MNSKDLKKHCDNFGVICASCEYFNACRPFLENLGGQIFDHNLKINQSVVEKLAKHLNNYYRKEKLEKLLKD